MVQAKIKYLDVLWHHRGFALIMLTLMIGAVAYGTSLQQKIYKVDAEIFISPKPSAVTGENSAVSDTDYRMLNNQVEILSSDKVAKKAKQIINEKLGKDYPVPTESTIRGRVSVHKKDYTNVIAVSLVSPGKASVMDDVLHYYLQAYTEVLKGINSKKSEEEHTFLKKEYDAARERMETLALELQKYESENQTYNIDTQVNQMLHVAGRLDEQTKTLNGEIAAARRTIASARAHLPSSPEYINLIARLERDPETNDLRKRIINLENERAEWSSKLTEAHPKMMAFDKEIKRVQGMLEKRLNNFTVNFKQKGPTKGIDITTGSNLDFAMAADVLNSEIKLEAMQARAETLNDAQEEVMGMLRGVPEQALGYMKRKNELEMTQDKLKVLQRRLDEASLMQKVSSDFTQVEILKEPVEQGEGSYIKPNMNKNLLAAVLLGFCVSLFGVFIRASLDPTLRWPFQLRGMVESDEEQTIFTMPVLPSRQSFAAMLERTNFVVPEPYKRLIIHLENLSKSDNVRRVGVMPVTPFADCNITTVALSLYLTELSNKMVLIDTDYSKNSVTSLVRSMRLPLSVAIQEGPGLSDYLCGETEDFVDVIYPLGKTVYGSYIPAGDPVHDTGFQFSHRNLGQLEENLSPNYNFVIYGLSSIEQSYDAIAVSRTLDGVILLVHPGVTTLDEIQQSIRELEAVHCRVLGMMVQPLKK